MQDRVQTILRKSFGGLSSEYYFRHFIFGLVITALFTAVMIKGGNVRYLLVLTMIVNTLLYPYARFVYESIVSFIMGNNVLFVNAVILFFWKIMTVMFCWWLAIFIAPIGLGYIYFRQQKLNGRN